MAVLRVYFQNQLKFEVNLDSQKRWTIGRDPEENISLTEDSRVSRKHLVITKTDSEWLVEKAVPSAVLTQNGNPIEQIKLIDKSRFEIPGYEFEFTPLKQEEAEDKTTIGILPSYPLLELLGPGGEVVQSFSLSGNAWRIGRDPSNEVYINHRKLSRSHFEIKRDDGEFYIRDLGSSNGTLLNGRVLPPEQWVLLQSSDEIAIYDLKIRFTIKDASFEERRAFAEKALTHSEEGQATIIYQQDSNLGFQEQTTGSESSARGSSTDSPLEKNNIKPIQKIFNFFKNPLRAALGIVAILLIIFALLMGGDSPPLTETNNQNVNLSLFDKLSEEQKSLVRQLYRNAQNFLQQGKYDLAKEEIMKLHQIIPSYEDSKQIEETANQALLLIQEKERAEAEERERQRIADEIRLKVTECRKFLKKDMTMEELDTCLAPVIPYDPENPEIVSLKNEANRLIEEYAMEKAKKDEIRKNILELAELYRRGVDLEKSQDWLEAIKAYQVVIKSPLDDPSQFKRLAKIRKNRIEKELLRRQKKIEEEAQRLVAQDRLREAITLIREAMLINPSNQVIVGLHEEWMNELRKKMMVIYQDATFEESIGEIESAKQKWNKILEKSLPGEDYYEKSKVKLKKYGFL